MLVVKLTHYLGIGCALNELLKANKMISNVDRCRNQEHGELEEMPRAAYCYTR